ncbi:MAG: efflux RND transporter periplasmic adaptor subunit [Myxococcales bacterium]|nr:efflux RND transporter periplasmic adaptor subunit [Myxococcales bacterium]
MIYTRSFLFAALTATRIVLSPAAFAHEGHADAPGGAEASSATGGPVLVSETARKNLGLRLEEAELRPIERTLTVIGEIHAEPERSATVSSRIPGRVVAVFAKEGERVHRGQPLVEIESLQVGDPPPRARYTAPIDGTVTHRHVVVGDDVEPRGHLFELTDLQEVLAVGRVFEGQIGRVTVGQTVRVHVPSYPEEAFEGIVDRMGGALDPRSRSLPVFVRIANPDRKLRLNMRATLSLVVERSDLALAVPKETVLGEFGHRFVFVQRDGEPDLFDRRSVVTGLSDDRYIEILEGILPGDQVVSEGNYSLQYLTPVAEPGSRETLDTAETGAHPPHTTRWWLWALGIIGVLALGAAAWVLRGRARVASGAR